MNVAQEILALERAALDRWNRGDPGGYLEISAPDVIYIDPYLEHHLRGLEALASYYAPIAGKILTDRYEMLDPAVQVFGDAAVLSFRLISYRKREDGTEQPLVHWNSTEVYRKGADGWKIAHTHWSLVKPELKTALLE